MTLAGWNAQGGGIGGARLRAPGTGPGRPRVESSTVMARRRTSSVKRCPRNSVFQSIVPFFAHVNVNSPGSRSVHCGAPHARAGEGVYLRPDGVPSKP